MLTIVFGAGASYDSNPGIPTSNNDGDQNYNINYRPPLAKDLFSDRFKKIIISHPKAGSLYSRLRGSAPNIEQELEKIYNESGSYPRTTKQLMSMRYYLKDVIVDSQNYWNNETSKVTTYKAFLNIVDHWQVQTNEDVSLITFNYDTLLDDACKTELDMSFPNIDSYIENSTAYKLFKVHGSVDWVRKINNCAGDPIEAAEHIKYTGEFYSSEQSQGEVDEFTKFIPAIAIPTQTKTFFEMPDSHLVKLKNVISSTNLLMTIGWRGTETHFNDLWKEKDKKVVMGNKIVSGSFGGGKIIKENLSNGGISIPYTEVYDLGFSSFTSKELSSYLNAHIPKNIKI
jgi:hypothetical protein